VVGHEGKCRHLHGHNGRVHFHCVADNNELDSIGRVIDFGEVKSRLCMWLEDNWDHKFLAWENDKVINGLFISTEESESVLCTDSFNELRESIVFVPFNPTAENMSEYLVDIIGPQQLLGTGIKLVSVTIDETRKCSVTYGE
jgi:6-pyruvoyltetrahydropterin/6-carboxytetrahydropterin synthase